MASEVLQKGKVYRILADAANQVWDKISFFTHADDVEFSDGQNASIKVGAINGITDDLTCEDPSIAASSVAVKQLNESLDSILVYSTNETICGTWINGEKLYRKVYTFTLPTINSTQWTNLFQLPTNIKVKNMRGILSVSTSIYILPYIEEPGEPGDNNYSVYISISSGYLRALGTNGYKGGSVEFIIEYTY